MTGWRYAGMNSTPPRRSVGVIGRLQSRGRRTPPLTFDSGSGRSVSVGVRPIQHLGSDAAQSSDLGWTAWMTRALPSYM